NSFYKMLCSKGQDQPHPQIRKMTPASSSTNLPTYSFYFFDLITCKAAAIGVTFFNVAVLFVHCEIHYVLTSPITGDNTGARRNFRHPAHGVELHRMRNF